MKTIPHRVVIYAKDVMNITGKKERTAQKLLSKIRKSLGKPSTAYVSVQEFCTFTGLKSEEITAFIR